MSARRVAVVTGAGRSVGIAAGIAPALAEDGWDLVLAHWSPWDVERGLATDEGGPEAVAEACRAAGAEVRLVAADLSTVEGPAQVLAAAPEARALVLCHAVSVDSSVLDTTVESWDRHFAVNARASWLLIKAFAERLPASAVPGEATGRVVALTSDHTAHNLPYGASKGALDRLVIAAAVELGERGLRANVVNPGPIDTGWMDDGIRQAVLQGTPAGRAGTPRDTADLVRFLLSDAGGWITGQLLYSSGGFHTSG